VYGVVAGIVKLDDAGLYLSRRKAAFAQAVGRGLLAAAPWLMKALSVIGTIAMFMVGGGILGHALPPLHHLAEAVAGAAGQVPGIGRVLAAVAPTLVAAVAGVVTGALVLVVVSLVGRLRRKH
jgi:predicted DNA repair protein MutK